MPSTTSITEPEVPLISPLEIAAGIDDAYSIVRSAWCKANGTEPEEMLWRTMMHLKQSLDIAIAAILHGEAA